MSISFDLDPDDGWEALLALSDAGMVAPLVAALNATALEAEALIAEKTPVLHARLRDSWKMYPATPDSLEAGVATTVEYAPYVEWGTGVHSDHPDAPRQPIVIRARFARALKFAGADGGDVFRKVVTIQGMKPRAMVRRSIPEIEQRLEEWLGLFTAAAMHGDDLDAGF